MKRMVVCAALTALSVLWWLTGTAGATTQKVGDMDQQFLMQAASDGMAEVQQGQMAGQQATSPAVRQFGQQMVTDHTVANQELMAIAQAKNITVPTQLDKKHQEKMEALSKLQGASFDREYMRQQVTAHEKAVQLFSKASQESQDADIKAFATKTLPTLQGHLRMAREVAQQQGVSQAR